MVKIKALSGKQEPYVLIIGGRYGTIEEDSGNSFTEKEYDFAVSKGIFVIALLHGDPGKIPLEKSEEKSSPRKKLDAFREKVEKERLCKYWNTTQELGGQVSRSFAQAIQRHPAVGWVRGDLVPNESSAETINRLRNENDELKSQLDRLSKQGPPDLEKYAQGEEVFLVHYSFLPNFESPRFDTVWNLSWNKIFGAVAIPLMTAAPESQIKNAIEKLIESELNQHDVAVNNEDLVTIQVQLRALGLIQNTNQPGIWTLTPFGNEQLLKLKAIRRIQ